MDDMNYSLQSPHEAWFNCDDRERRQRLLDFLITHR